MDKTTFSGSASFLNKSVYTVIVLRYFEKYFPPILFQSVQSFLLPLPPF